MRAKHSQGQSTVCSRCSSVRYCSIDSAEKEPCLYPTSGSSLCLTRRLLRFRVVLFLTNVVMPFTSSITAGAGSISAEFVAANRTGKDSKVNSVSFWPYRS